MALFSKKEPMTASDLSHITRGLHQAAAATHQVIAQQYIKLFDQFFDYDPEDLGTPMKAKMVEVVLDEGHILNIPLITLVAPRGLALSAMKVDMSVRMQGTELEKARDEGKDKRMQFQLDPVELSVEVGVEKDVNGNIGWKVIGLGGSYAKTTTQTLTLKLTPLWKTPKGLTKDFAIASSPSAPFSSVAFGPSVCVLTIISSSVD